MGALRSETARLFWSAGLPEKKSETEDLAERETVCVSE